jgi:Tfp pilus assembly protein PilF
MLGIPFMLVGIIAFSSAIATASPKIETRVVTKVTVIPQTQIKNVTVSIYTSNSNGSGVIVHRQGGKYLVLTAAHVVRNQQNSYNIGTADGQKHPLTANSIKFFPNGIDLAIVSFNSSKTYPIAAIGNSDDAEEGSIAAVSGYPRNDKQSPVYSFRQGRIVARSSKALADGYGIVYSASTLPGMSGGGVFNERGELIAIHGKGDINTDLKSVNANFRIKTGYDLGIPINTFVQKAKGISGLPSFTQARAQDKNRPRSADALVSGLNEMRNKQCQRAISFFDQAIKLNSQDATAYYYRGLCYQSNKNLQAALADFNRSIQLNPKDPFPYIFRASTYSDLKDQSKMASDLNRAVAIDPNNSYAYMFRATLYFDPAKKQTNKAFADLNRAISLDPNNGQAYTFRGLLYMSLKERAKFMADFRRASAIYKANGEVENYNNTKNLLEIMQKYGTQ